jgi:hypothetical protein
MLGLFRPQGWQEKNKISEFLIGLSKELGNCKIL